MVYAIRPSFNAGNIRPTQFFGIMSSILLSLALFPQYYEIHRYHEVKGISIPFMAIDLMGGVFSDLSLVFKAKFDVIAGVAYSLVVVLDGIVILAAVILNPMTRKRRRQDSQTAVVDADGTGVIQEVCTEHGSKTVHKSVVQSEDEGEAQTRQQGMASVP
ncbi:hypothetical protein PHLGIDRAFT_121965 [Phlebiopsis gigantea 11061_1 CR5-6]|uniref:PQ-loop repeat-containing protein n=1 Tax=Phlebiopsis gigantea (strain 11061_1 CR5-6) TaxID=745531 RepID=A0A0C3PCV5_PHLG1|nr:hypothetical protein PHLGIDRAFT_121965 [Phlebiopsis gigantea 11061_1 CR5-6]